MKSLLKINFLDYFILFCIFIVPLIWSKYLNANYYSAKFFLVYFVAAFSLFASSRRLHLPGLPKFLSITIGYLIFLHLVSPVVSQNWSHIFYMFKFLSFAFLAYYFYGLEIDLEAVFKKYGFLLFGVVGLIVVFALNDFYKIRVERLELQSGFILGSFGNVNMMAEFLILSLPLVHLGLRTKSSVPTFFKYLVFLAWVFFIFYCRSRSAWIGFGLWLTWCGFNKKINVKEAIAILAAFGLYQFAMWAPVVDTVVTSVKSESFEQRLHLYVSTLRLIQDNPFGVGVGQYSNEIIPYLVNSDFRPMEYVYFDQPHSEVLKWAVQFGWVGFVLPVILLFGLLRQMWQKRNFFLLSSFCVVLPQIFFQFPFENPASLMYLSFLFGLCLSLFPVARDVAVGMKKRMMVGVLGIVGIVHAFAFVSSIFLETSHGNDLDFVILSCDIYPVNANACFNRNQFLMATNNYVQARMSMSEDLTKFPFHAGLMRLLPIYLKNKSTDQYSCEAVLMYDYIFMNQKFFPVDVTKRCAEFVRPVTHVTAKQFRNDYLDWQKKVLQPN